MKEGLTSFVDTPNLQLYIEQLSLKRNLKTSRATLSHWGKEKKTTLKWEGEMRHSHHKPHPAQRLTIGRELKTWSFSLRREGFLPHFVHPNF